MRFSFYATLVAALLFFSFTLTLQNRYTPPVFPGGTKALNSYFVRYADYPAEERETGVNGDCEAMIYISKSGQVKFVNVTGTHRNFNREAKRVLSLMPDWKPAKRGGVEIDTFVVRKIMFSLEKSRAANDSNVTELMLYAQPVTMEKDKEFYIKLAQKDLERIKRAPVYDQAVQALRDSQYVDAVHLFNKVQMMGETGRDLYFNKGIAYYQLEEVDSACACWKTAARLGDEEAVKVYNQKCR
jgi:hypothetical protein